MTLAIGTKVLGAGVTIVVVVAVVTAIVLDPPGLQRQLRMDQRRVEDLLSIQRAAEEYWSRHKALPPDLATLDKEPGLFVPANDPETGSPYVYEVIGPRAYRLCAVFARDTANDDALLGYLVAWAHGVGRQCFERNIPMARDDPKVPLF